MKLLLMLAWRNLRRNRRRSLLTITAVAFATFLTLVFRGVGVGTWDYSLRNTVTLFSGFLEVQQTGYQDAPTLQKCFAYPGSVASILRNTPGVTGYAPRVLADGLVSCGATSSGAAILGIDPVAERAVSQFSTRVRDGRMLRPDAPNEIVVGYTLLRNLGVSVGDSLVILAQGYDGVMGNQWFHVVGALRMGVPDFDAMTVVMTLPAAQQLLAMEGRVNVVAVACPDLNDVDATRQALRYDLRAAGLGSLAVLSWDEVMPELKQAMEVDLINDTILLVVLVVIVAFGILNTVLMSVTERFREFGISLAMGMKPAVLVRLVFLETLFIAGIGLAIGGGAGQLLNWYFEVHPVPISGELARFYEDYGFIPQIVSTARLSLFLICTGGILAVSLLAAVYPAIRVSRLEPLKGIRYT